MYSKPHRQCWIIWLISLVCFFSFLIWFLISLNVSLLASFSYRRLLVVPHFSLYDSNSSKVFGTLLGILTDASNAVVWMSRFLWFPIFPGVFQSLWRPLQAHQLQLGSWLPSCFVVSFSSLAKSKYLSIFWVFFTCSPSENQQDDIFFSSYK